MHGGGFLRAGDLPLRHDLPSAEEMLPLQGSVGQGPSGPGPAGEPPQQEEGQDQEESGKSRPEADGQILPALP